MKKEKISENLKNFNKLVSDEVSPALKNFIKKTETTKKAFENFKDKVEQLKK